jgi:cold shock CspA family protein
MSEEIRYGVVKWFDSKKGFGFLYDCGTGEVKDEGNDKGKDPELFFHIKQVSGFSGENPIKSGSKVLFFIFDGKRGKEAGSIKPRVDESLKFRS